jgi:hypothetical protein
MVIRVPARDGLNTGWRRRGITAGRLRFRFRLFDGGGLLNEDVHFGQLEPFKDAAAHSHNVQPGAVVLAADVVVDDRAHSGRIHVGNPAEVEDGELGSSPVRSCACKSKRLIRVMGPVSVMIVVPAALPSLRSMVRGASRAIVG